MIEPDDVIVLQGDSITDGGRDRVDGKPTTPAGLGSSYAFLVGSVLRRRRPTDQLTFYNRGIAGDRVVDLAERWREDCIDLEPNLLSVLIGVNDTWRGFDAGPAQRVDVDRYEQVYRQLLTDVRQAHPRVKLVLGEPFVLVCGVVTEAWLAEIDARRRVVDGLCEEFGGRLVKYQDAFNAAAELAPPEHWLGDGVHPTMAGHQLMAETWLEAVGERP